MLETKRIFRLFDVSYLPLGVGAVVTVAAMYVLFGTTQAILKERLKERISAIVSTAVLQFDSDSISKIIKDREELSKQIKPLLDESTTSFDKQKMLNEINKVALLRNHPIWKITQQMKEIREKNINLKYIYLLELTGDPDHAKFVTDSDTVLPVDWNGNGIIDEIEYPPLPGEDYDITDIPAAQKATDTTQIMDDLYTDKWGSFLSGYAPIKDKDGKTVAVLGIDVQVDDFYKLIRATLTPFLVVAIALLTMLSIQTLALVRIWKNRVDFVKELDRQKDELLSIVSHQLATPIASVKWYIEMLLDGDLGELNEEQKKQLETVMHSSQNLSDLVGMILDVSRIQLGRVRIEKQQLDLNSFFSEIFEVVEPKATEKHVNFVKSVPAKLPEAMLDRRYTRMTIENLMTNAIKYTPEGGRVDVNISIDGKWLHVVVKDTGCGIPASDQKQIFGKMYRATNVRNSSIDGNGFGLYVAKGAVESQGGEIWFQSTEGKGTTFFVKLPINDAKNS